MEKKWAPIPKFYNPLMAGSIDGTDTDPHDQAVIRAMNAKYKPNAMVNGEAFATVFVSKLSHRTDEDALYELFSKFGEIKHLRLVRDIVTGFPRGYAFIEYGSEKEAYRASREGHAVILDDKEIFVDFECERTLPGWIPRRLGGGFGGKKESGQLRFGGKSRPFKEPIIVNKDEQGERTRLYIAGDLGRGDNSRDERYRDRWRDRDRGGFSERREYRKSDRDRDYTISRRDRSRSRDRRRGRSRSRDRSRSQGHSRGRSRSRSREKSYRSRRRER